MGNYLVKASRLFIFINLIFCGAIGVLGQTACLLTETIETKSTKKTMDVKLDKFSFSVPAELEDQTIYTFGSENGEEILEVIYSAAMGNIKDSKSSVTDFRIELESLAGKAVRVESEMDTTIADLPAREIKYMVAGEGNRLSRSILADAYDKSNKHIIRIAYTKESGGEISAEFELMRSSAVRTRKLSDKQSPAGYKRQFAGEITLDVKETLAPPRRFSFGSVNGKFQPYLELSFYLESEKPPSFDQEKTADEESMGKLNGEVSSSSFENEKVDGTQFNYSLVKKPYPNITEKFAVRRAHLKMSSGIQVHLSGRANANVESDLDRCFTNMLNSVTPLEVEK